MRSNKELGFTPIWGVEGQVSSEAIADGGGRAKTINLTVGRRGDAYRAYAYLWESDQDPSREGIRDEVATRGATATEALRQWRVAALRRGWHQPGVEAAYSDALDELAEEQEA